MELRVTTPSGWRTTRFILKSKVAKAALEIAGTLVIITHSASRISTPELTSRRPCAARAAISSRCLADGFEATLHQRDLRIDDARGTVDQQTLGGVGRAGQHHDVGDARYQRE